MVVVVLGPEQVPATAPALESALARTLEQDQVATAGVTRTLEVPVTLAMLGEILEPVVVVEFLLLEAHLEPVVVVEVLLLEAVVVEVLPLEAHLEPLLSIQEELLPPFH